MIQRVQSIWLLIAAIVTAATMYFSFYKMPNGQILTLQSNYIGIILVSLTSIICLVALFQFKKRKSQLSLIWFAIIGNIALLVWLFISISKEVESLTSTVENSGAYRFGTFVPIVSIIFLLMARSGIKKDMKLLKAYDRLR